MVIFRVSELPQPSCKTEADAMTDLVRKDFRITPQQRDKLKRLANEWHCSESAVLRRAIDDWPDSEIRERSDQTVEEQTTR